MRSIYITISILLLHIYIYIINKIKKKLIKILNYNKYIIVFQRINK